MADLLFRLHDQRVERQGQQLLSDITLDIHKGERVALVGESGAGKSTLLRLLRQSQSLTTRSVKARHDAVAWCPQELGLVPQLSVFHNIYMGRLSQHRFIYNLLSLIRPQGRELADISALSETVGLPHKLHTGVASLSGGEQQRTAIARALYQQAEVFIGDEPVSSVDPFQADQLLSLIVKQHQTVVLAMHDLQLARRYCHRIIGLKQGRIVMDERASCISQNKLSALFVNQQQIA